MNNSRNYVIFDFSRFAVLHKYEGLGVINRSDARDRFKTKYEEHTHKSLGFSDIVLAINNNNKIFNIKYVIQISRCNDAGEIAKKKAKSSAKPVAAWRATKTAKRIANSYKNRRCPPLRVTYRHRFYIGPWPTNTSCRRWALVIVTVKASRVKN